VALRVDDSSALCSRVVRNHFDHFDEKLDEWWKGSRSHSYADLNFGSIEGFDPIDVFRRFDSVSGTVTFWGRPYEIPAIVAELRRILPLARGGWDALCDLPRRRSQLRHGCAQIVVVGVDVEVHRRADFECLRIACTSFGLTPAWTIRLPARQAGWCGSFRSSLTRPVPTPTTPPVSCCTSSPMRWVAVAVPALPMATGSVPTTNHVRRRSGHYHSNIQRRGVGRDGPGVAKDAGWQAFR
jgi:hypothetical protein